MKVIFLRRNNPFAVSSAAANRYRTIMEGLTAKGVLVQLIITDGYQSKIEKEQFKRSGKAFGVNYVYLFPFLFSNYWLKRINNYILNPAFLPYKVNKIRRVLKREGQGTIIWPSVSLEQLRAIKRKRSDLIYFAESNEFPDIHRYNKGNPIQRWFADQSEGYFEKYTFPLLDGMALMTKTLLKYYSELPSPRPKLLHLPMTVDLNRFDKPLPTIKRFEKPYIAFVGVMNNAKDGVDILIEAFARIAVQFPNYKLYLVGPWHYDTPGHQKMIKKLGLEKRVFWMGEYSRDTIPAIIKNADLLALPRPDSKQAQGGFPTKLGEYLATGNPVCATTVGEIPDYLVDGESVYFAEPGSVYSFANAMQLALDKPLTAKKIGSNGRKVAELHFNKETQAKSLYDFLKSLIDK
ncbi:MAG: glycosyltransferase [Lentimicrobium sp.]|nr:glycosyltransferase [Lentimicrobium sp.]